MLTYYVSPGDFGINILNKFRLRHRKGLNSLLHSTVGIWNQFTALCVAINQVKVSGKEGRCPQFKSTNFEITDSFYTLNERLVTQVTQLLNCTQLHKMTT